MKASGLRIFIAVLFQSFLFLGCDEVKDCTPQTNDFVSVAFLDKTTGDPLAISFDSIFELNTQVLLFVANDSTSIFEIPLNPETGLSAYLFAENGNSDSLEILYRATANIISDECGVELVFTNMELISTTFDSVRVIENQFFTQLNSKNIEIFR